MLPRSKKKKRDGKNDSLKIAGSNNNWDLNMPYIPGDEGQSYKGIPNASPEMLKRLQQRKLKNTGGQQLPGFVKGV